MCRNGERCATSNCWGAHIDIPFAYLHIVDIWTLVVYAYGWFSVRVVVCVFHSEDFCLPNFNATQWTASVHTLHMSKPNVTRVQSATQ